MTTIAATASAQSQPPYAFFPMAGNLWEDISGGNYVDLQSAPGVKQDYECTNSPNDGHNGHDVIINGFREQEIGVPIFAALDGTVIAMHDGEFDRETTPGDRPVNFVALLHEGGYQTQYLHMRRFSITVSLGQFVKAGTMIGMTGSSGNSTWPHLHFATFFNGAVVEPNAGPCRPGASYWRNQKNTRNDGYIISFTFADGPFDSMALLPTDLVGRRGSYVLGADHIHFRLLHSSIPANSSYRIVLRRPDGSTQFDVSNVLNGTNSVQRNLQSWWNWNTTLDVVGEWMVDFYVGTAKVATAPFDVVPFASDRVNRPPYAPGALTFDPSQPATGDVVFCRVAPAVLYRRDPDYDRVHYRYKWYVNGVLRRDQLSAALSDAIPSGLYKTGDALTCVVTSFDDTTTGPTASVSLSAARAVSRTNDFDGDGASDLAVFRAATGAWDILYSAGGAATMTWGSALDQAVPGDYDGDGVADLAVFRQSTGTWSFKLSLYNYLTSFSRVWGLPGDVPVPADYDGDGKTDVAVFRRATGQWWISKSSGGSEFPYWGAGTDEPAPGDYDGDGKADLATFRPSTGAWYIRTSNGGSFGLVWGSRTDRPVPGDYDGDGITDLAVFRRASGTWYILTSSSNFKASLTHTWGAATDWPVLGDFDGDGRTDITVWRPSTGRTFISYSSRAFTISSTVVWGSARDFPIGAVRPRVDITRRADFDGDARTDITVYRAATGRWYSSRSIGEFNGGWTRVWGNSLDVPVSGDFDGDGISDIAVYRRSTGAWYVLTSSTAFSSSLTVTWGAGNDLLAPGDYDGDAITDFAVYRPETGIWYILKSSTNLAQSMTIAWGGAPGDLPVPGDFDGDGATDIAVWRPTTGEWLVRESQLGFATTRTHTWGANGDVPLVGDFDGDGVTDLAVFRPSTGIWYVATSTSGLTASFTRSWGTNIDTPVPGDYDGDGKTDVAVWRESTGVWYVAKSNVGLASGLTTTWGASGDLVVPERR